MKNTDSTADKTILSNTLASSMLSGTASQNLQVTDGLRLWLKADTGTITDANGKISQWLDQSGKGNHATQTTAARQPVLTNNLNDTPAVNFSAASTQYLSFSNFMAGATAGEVFVVTRAVTATPSATRSLWRFGTESNGSFYPHSNGTLQDSFGSSSIKNTAVPSTDLSQWHVYNATATSGEWGSRLNGNTQFRVTTNAIAWQAAPTLGRGNTTYYDGDIAEIVIYDRVLSDFERSAVEAYLATRSQIITAPVTPTNLCATALDAAQANITWQNEIAAWTTFEVQRNINGTTFETIAETRSVGYLDTSLAPKCTAKYRVRTVNPIGTSPWSNETTIVTPAYSVGAFPVQNLKLWLKADNAPLGPIAIWQDHADQANVAAASAPSNRPEVKRDENGRKIISFSATSSQHLTLPPVMTGATSGEAFVITRISNAAPTATRSLWRFGSETNGTYYPHTSGTLSDSFGSNTLKSTGKPTADLTQWHIYSASSQVGAWGNRVNNEAHFSTSTNTVTWHSAPFLGRGNTTYFDGDIAELVVFDRTLTDAERNIVGRYLYSQIPVPAIMLPSIPHISEVYHSGPGEAWISWSAAETVIPSTECVIERRGVDGQWCEIATATHSNTFHFDRDLATGDYAYRLKNRSWAGDTAYGNTVTVSITSALAETIPSNGLRLWLRADLGVTTDDVGNVQQWSDVSGQSNHATQAIAAARPILATSATPDQRPVVRFTRATAQKLELPVNLMAGAVAGTAFAVLRNNTAKPASHSGLWRIGSTVGYYPNTSGVLTDSFGTNAARDLGTPQIDITSRHLLEITASAGQWLTHLNGFGQTSTDTNVVAWHATPLLGHNGSSTYAFDGDIEEVLIFDRVLSPTECEGVRRHLNARYGFAASSPTAPANLHAHAGVQGGVELTWLAPHTQPATRMSYIVERSTDGGPFADVGCTHWLNHVDSSAQAGHTHIYRVKARNWFGESTYVTTSPLSLDASDTLPVIPARSDLRLWLRADQGVFTDNDSDNRMQGWQDQSGNENHAIQLTPANRPVLATDADTGASVVRFTATQKQSLSFLDVMRGTTSAEIIIRLKTSAASYTTDNGLWKWSSTGTAYPTKSGTLTDGTASNVNQLQGTPVVALNEWQTYSISAASGQWISRLNGIEQYRAATNTVAFISTPLLGTNGSTWFDGDIAEVLIYNRPLDDSEREQLTQYLDARSNPSETAQPPATPIGLMALAESTSTVVVRWTPPTETDSNLTYILERRTEGPGVFEEILRANNGYTTRTDYTDHSLAAGSMYTYRIKARNNVGLESAFSEATSATTHASIALDSTWPSDIAPGDLRLWLRSDLGLIQSHDGNIVTWEDQSGKNNHATQPTVANQPTSGQCAVTFDATKSQALTLPTSLFTGASSGDIFVVLKIAKNTPSANRGLWNLGTSTNYYLQSNGTITECAGTSTPRVLGAPGVDTTSWHVYNVTAASGEWVARINGRELLRDSTANTVKWTTAPKLGQGSSYFQGDVAEVIMYSSVLSETQRERITKHLLNRHTELPVSSSAPEIPSNLVATSNAAGESFVAWQSADMPSTGVTYILERRLENEANFAPVLSYGAGNALFTDFTDTGLAPGSVITYRFRARDHVGRETIGSETATITVAANATPGTLTERNGLRLWLRADRGIVTANDGHIAAWMDQSGLNNHARQLVPANRPSAQASGNAVAFDSTKTEHFTLPSAFMSGAVAGEVFVVLKSNTTASASRSLWRMGSSNSSQYPASDGSLRDDFGANTYRQLGTAKADLSQTHIYHVTSKAGEWTAQLNDFEMFRTTTNTVSWNTSPLLGSNGSAGFDGEISEILVYDQILSDEARNSVRTYLDERHSIGISTVPPTPTLSAREIAPVGVELSWELPTINIEAHLILERRDETGNYSHLATLGKHDRAYTDSSVELGHIYGYRIKVANIAGNGAWSNEPHITVITDTTIPSLSSGLRMWLKNGQRISISTGQRIIRWEDCSGQNNHATQSNLSYMPVLADSGTVQFTIGKNQQLTLPVALMSSATEGEIFVILKGNSETEPSSSGLWRMGYGSSSNYPDSSGAIRDDAGSSIPYSMGTPVKTIAQRHLYNVSSKPQEWIARLNGTEQYRSTTNTVKWSTAPLLGSNGSYGFGGEVLEILVYNRVLTDAEHNEVSSYLAKKYLPNVSIVSDPPRNLRALILNSTQVNLNWQSQLPAFCTQELQRMEVDGHFATIASPAGLSYVDTSLSPGTTYIYRLRINGPMGAGDWSDEVRVMMPGDAKDATVPISSLRLWLKADTGIVADKSARILRWEDQSGNNYHLTQPSASYQPTSGIENGHPVVCFDAAQKHVLRLAAFDRTDDARGGEVFLALKATSKNPAANRGLWTIGSTSSSTRYPSTGGYISEKIGTTTQHTLNVPDSDISSMHVYNISATNGNWVVRLNGQPLRRTRIGIMSWSGQLQLGSNGSDFFDGAIAEALIFDRMLTNEERDAVERYLVTKHDLPQAQVSSTPPALHATLISETQVNLEWHAQSGTWISYELQRKRDNHHYETIVTTKDLSFYDSSLHGSTNYTYRIRCRTPNTVGPWSEEIVVDAKTAKLLSIPVSSLKLWLQGDSLSATPRVFWWGDQSGAANDASISGTSSGATPSSQMDASINHKVVSFDAANLQYMDLPQFMNGVSEAETFVVLKATSARPSQNRGLWRLSASNSSLYPNPSGALSDGFGAASVKSLGIPKTDIASWHVLNLTAGDRLWTARLNNAKFHSTTSNTVYWNTTPIIGYSGTYAFDGNIAEVLIFDRALTTDERNATLYYLATRYSLDVPLAPLMAPSAPAAFSATSIGENAIRLNWAASPSSGSSYELDRQDSSGIFIKIADLEEDIFSYTDNALTPGTRYTYQLRTKRNEIVSESTPAASATTWAIGVQPIAPPAPINFKRQLKLDERGHLFTWSAVNQSPPVSYRLYFDGKLVGITSRYSLDYIVKEKDPGFGVFSIKSVSTQGIESTSTPELTVPMRPIYESVNPIFHHASIRIAPPYFTQPPAGKEPRFFLSRKETYSSKYDSLYAAGESQKRYHDATSHYTVAIDPATGLYKENKIEVTGSYQHESLSSTGELYNICEAVDSNGIGVYIGSRTSYIDFYKRWITETPWNSYLRINNLPWIHALSTYRRRISDIDKGIDGRGPHTFDDFTSLTETTASYIDTGRQQYPNGNQEIRHIESNVVLSDEYTKEMHAEYVKKRIPTINGNILLAAHAHIAEFTTTPEYSEIYRRGKVTLSPPPTGTILQYRYCWDEIFVPADGSPKQVLRTQEHILQVGDEEKVLHIEPPTQEGKIYVHTKGCRLIPQNGMNLVADGKQGFNYTNENPLYLHINDDDDNNPQEEHLVYKSNGSLQSGAVVMRDCDDDKINGECDRKDFLPIRLDIVDLLTPWSTGSGKAIKVLLKHADEALNYTWTPFDARFLPGPWDIPIETGFGPKREETSYSATVTKITKEGTEIGSDLLAEMVKKEYSGVIWVEACKATAEPLVMEVWKNDQLIHQSTLPIGVIEIVDRFGRGIKQARFGLWDKAYDYKTMKDGVSQELIVLNESSAERNFIERDTRRFYIKITKPIDDNTPPEDLKTLMVDWFTTKPDGSADDHPSGLLTLQQESPESNTYISKAVMLVTDGVDAAQTTNDGFGNIRQRGQLDHRLRKADLEGKLHIQVVSDNEETSASVFSIPIFKKHEMRRLKLNIVNYYHRSNDPSHTTTYFTRAEILDEIRETQLRWSQVGLKIDAENYYERPVPGMTINIQGETKFVIDREHEDTLMRDMMSINSPPIPDCSATVVCLSCGGITERMDKDFNNAAVAAWAGIGLHPNVNIGLRYFIYMLGKRGVNPNPGIAWEEHLAKNVLGHELHHILFNKPDLDENHKRLGSQYFTLNSKPKKVRDDGMPDVRYSRRMHIETIEWHKKWRFWITPYDADLSEGPATGNVFTIPY